nr:hypothetical protein [Tanacetum cinerariifolium]
MIIGMRWQVIFDFTACDVPNFDGALDPIGSTRWLVTVEGVFHTSNCKEKNKVKFDSNFLRDSAKMCRARVREVDLLRKKNKEVKETKRKTKFGEQDAKKPRHDQEVEIIDDKVVVVSNVFRNVEIEIVDSNFKIDLIPIMLGVFDIVIGMDWLEKHDANILCNQNLIQIINPHGREIIIYRDRRKGDFKLSSIVKARRYKSRGCHAFLAHVIDTSFEKKGVEDVLIVNELLDVFPEDLSCIPPERQVDPAMIEAVMNWQAPKNVGEIQSFLGLVGYYRRFIQDFFKIASSLMKLTRKNAPFEWEGTKDVVTYSDASYSALGCVLIQRGKVYDCEIHYHPGKANVVTDASSQKKGKVTRIYSLRMIVTTDLFDKIKAAHVGLVPSGGGLEKQSRQRFGKDSVGFENHPHMLNKENYVPWSSRLLCYAKSRPNGNLIYNSIMNGPYVSRMIPEPGDADREVLVNETFHEQTNNELIEKELKQIEANDQAI